MEQIALLGAGLRSLSPIVTAQRRLNCFYDQRSDGDKNQFILRGTPGTISRYSLPTGPVRGWKVVRGVLYAVAGAKLYSIKAGEEPTVRGTLTTGTGYVSMADNGIELIIVDGLKGYVLTLATNAYVEITDGNFPAGATTVSFLNGRFQVEKANTRQYYVSQSYDADNWTPVIFAAKENNADDISAVQVLNGNLILWGSTSMEFWQDVGASPIPYRRINGATQTWGLAAKWSRAELSNSLVFLGQNPQGTVQVLKLNGYTPEPVSNSDIDNIIRAMGPDVWSGAVALTYMIDGHPMYQLTFPKGNRSLLYDDLTKQWQEVQTGLELQARHRADLGIVFNGLNYVSDSKNGIIYELRADVVTDNGEPIKRQAVSKHLRMGGNEFPLDEIMLDMETGNGQQTGQGSEPQIMMRISKDGGRTFGYERWVKIGRVGQYYSPRVIWHRLGSARDFVLEFTMTDPVPFIITSAFATTNQEGA